MSIQFGATVSFDTPKEFDIILQIEQYFPFMKYVEYRGERPFCFPGVTPQEKLDYYKSVLGKTSIRSTFHSTMYDINLATLNPWLKDANIACYREFIDLASDLGSEVLVVHGGHLNKDAKHTKRYEHFLEIAEANLCESLTELADYGQPRGVKIAVENLPPTSEQLIIWNIENHLKILNRVNHPNCGALFDMAHAFLHGLDVLDYLVKIRPHLFEIHAHNNMGELDDHQGLTNGKMDYLPILQHADTHDVPFIMEIKSYEEVMQTLQWLKKLLQDGDI